MKPVLFPSSTWDDVRNEVETCLRYLFRRELQEWGADRFYIAISEDGGLRFPFGSGGFMSRRFSEFNRVALSPRFTTHGPGMFINTDMIDALTQAESGDLTQASFELFCTIVVHETAHIIQERYPANHFSQLVDRKPSKRRASTLAPTAVEPLTDDQRRYGPRLVNWFDNFKYHQADFVRALVHAEMRARRHGWCPQEHRTTFGYYVRGSIGAYELALEDEIDSYADRSLNGIWQHEPPEMFTGGWERIHKSANWMKDITTTLIQLDAAERGDGKQHEPTQEIVELALAGR